MEQVSVWVRVNQPGRRSFRLKLNIDDLVTDLIQVVNEKTTLSVDIDLVTVKFDESIVDPGASVSQYISTSSEHPLLLELDELEGTNSDFLQNHPLSKVAQIYQSCTFAILLCYWYSTCMHKSIRKN